MSSFNYWIGLGYSPQAAQKLSKSKRQGRLRAKDAAFRAQQAAAAPPPKAPDAPEPTKIKGPEYETRDKSSAVKIKSKGSRRRRQATQRGTSQLRIPLNTGQSKSGGLNV
jgi:hypothetical protein